MRPRNLGQTTFQLDYLVVPTATTIPAPCGSACAVGDHYVLLRSLFQYLGGKKSGTVTGSTPGIFLLGRGGTGVRL